MKYLIIVLLLAGCAGQPIVYQDNPYQTRAIELVKQWNANHGTNLPAPVVFVGMTQGLDYGNDYCNSNGCTIAISARLISERPEYAMANMLPHELAHHICVITIPGCTPNDHSKAWQVIALELGLSSDDWYITH